MLCVYCSSETQVINSRHQKRVNNVWRRRKCLNCGTVFTTSEAPESAQIIEVQNGKLTQPFLRDKLFVSVYDSLRHRKTAPSDATALTKTIIAHLHTPTGAAIIQREVLIAETIRVLGRFDPVAKTYYAAFHKVMS